MRDMLEVVDSRPAWQARLWSAIEALTQFLHSSSAAGYKWSAIGLVVIFVVLAAALVGFGAPPVSGGPWDTATTLDAGWRIVNGQVPHTGFHVPLGPLTYLLTAFGMKIVAPSTASIAYGSILFVALLLPATWYLASARFSWLITFLVVFFEGLYLITPRPPGYPIEFTSYAMIYNRHGYVLIALLSICVFLDRRVSTKKTELIEGLLAGSLLALLLYCKITYFLAGVGLSILGVLVISKTRRWLLGFATSFSAVCTAFWVFFHISLYAYAMDIVTAGHAQSSTMRLSLLSQGIHNNRTMMYMLGFCLILCTYARSRKSSIPGFTFRLWLITGSLVAVSLWLLSGNTSQFGGLEDPMYFLAMIVFLEFFRRQNAADVTTKDSKARLAYHASLLLLLPAFFFPIVAREVASCAYAVHWDFSSRPHYDSARLLHSDNLRDFYISPTVLKDTGYWSVFDYPAKVNDGIDMLRANMKPDDRITTVAFANPFSFALAVPPANDNQLWWDLDVSFSRKHFPQAQDFLGQTTLAIVPRLKNRNSGCCFETADLMMELYGGYLNSHFHQIASSDVWILYRRNAGDASSNEEALEKAPKP